MEKVAEIESQIAALGGSIVAAPKREAPVAKSERASAEKSESLANVLERVMSEEKVMSVAEAMQAAQNAGYRSVSSQFRNIVNLTLSKDTRFRKVSRGHYVLANSESGVTA